MICRILLLIAVTSCVRGKQHRLALNYQAEENHNVTVEWQFSFNTGMSVNSVKIHCVFLFLTQLKVFFNLDESRVPRAEEHQHEQFSGRVRCDKDALSTGLVRLHLSRVRTEDTGLYLCRMATDFGKIVKKFSLNVTGMLTFILVMWSHLSPSDHEII
ncbi:hypothetical protein Q5P01_002776 [Channa striata]|uniref:Immunoglobulin V-set domain-containing protein n=1 Tax=Channa striata TaxID=64152 RepID=A0AA88P1B6_CHASR|nr:hypothetical protein Q5P01_002776 [Channa striata]